MKRTPLILLIAALGSAAAAYGMGNGALTLWLAISVLAALAAFVLLGMAVLRGAPSETTEVAPKAKFRRSKKAAVIDGSNVMHWDGEVARLAPLRDVIGALKAKGYTPGIIFDANAGYKLADRYLDDRDFAKLLKLRADRVLVVPKGEPADPTILASAREMGAKIVTDDRFRDWAGEYPEVTEPGHLVRGGYRDGVLWLDDEALAVK
jgi:hypothetical protein